MRGTGQRQAKRAVVGAARWTVWWIALAALWLLLDDTVAVPELITGAVAAALGASAAELVHAQQLVRVRLRAAWFRYIWRLPLAVVPDIGLLLKVLFRRLVLRKRVSGRFRAIHFESGRDDDPHDLTRRALAKAGGSFAPNTYVVGVDGERDLMLVHQLSPTGKARDVDPLELR